MPVITKTKTFFKCLKCKHEWEARRKNSIRKPRLCPNCKSVRWDDKELKKEKEKRDGLHGTLV